MRRPRLRILPLFVALATMLPGGPVTQAAAQSFSAYHAPVPASVGADAAAAAASARTAPAPLSASTLSVAPLSLSAFSPALSAPAAGFEASPTPISAPAVAAAAPAARAAAAAQARPGAAELKVPTRNASETEKASSAKNDESSASEAASLFDGSVVIDRLGIEPLRITLARGSSVETKAVRKRLGALGVTAPVRVTQEGVTRWDRVKDFVSFDWRMLLRSPKILLECYTKPNKQDYVYLATKTFGLNLIVRVGFAAVSVMRGDLTLLRAALMVGWYQGQDSVFTVFGQTYMKFIGRMTGMLRIGPAKVGDLLFIFMQLCSFEFINRLVLGPMGMNPLVYTWGGMSLILVNVLQGMLSGGPLIPAINKMRAAGAISESASMHLYQLASLTMLFGLAATFGYQALYTILTTATMIISWGAYAYFTFIHKGKKTEKAPEAKP